MVGPTIAFFPEGAYGPTNNCVGIGRVLRERGARVVFVVEESFAGALEAQGFEEALMRLKPKPEVGIQFGAGGATAPAELKAEGTRDPSWAIAQARRFLDAGADIIMIESEGITENVDPWRTDVPAKFIDEIGMEKLMFEAAEPDVFEWYIKNYGVDVNLFVDHSQIVQLECLRAGIWGTKSLWGRVVTFKARKNKTRVILSEAKRSRRVPR